MSFHPESRVPDPNVSVGNASYPYPYHDHSHGHGSDHHHELEMVNIDISGSGNMSRVTERKRAKEVYFDEEENKPYAKKGGLVANTIRSIWHDKDCKKLFLFAMLLLGVILVEIFYGSYAGSLGMISAAFHACFDFISIAISISAMVLAKHSPTKKFSYGYDRFEVIAGFSNGVFLLFVSFFLLLEIVERLFGPEPMDNEHTSTLVAVAILGIVVDIIGVIFFKEYSHIRSESKHALRDETMHGIFAHISIDTIASAGVIISVWLNSWGFLYADPLVAISIVGIIIYNSIPICKRTGKVLLQTTPLSIKDQLDKAIREASTLDGVLECCREHFWTQSPGIFVGSLVVRVGSDANEQIVLQRVSSLLSPLITHLTIQVEKEDFANIHKADHGHDSDHHHEHDHHDHDHHDHDHHDHDHHDHDHDHHDHDHHDHGHHGHDDHHHH